MKNPSDLNEKPIPIQLVSRGPRSVVIASWVLILLVCLLSLIPVLGFGAWLIAGPVLFVTLILGIVAIARGGTVQGVLILLMSLTVAPAFIALAPFIGTLLGTGAAVLAHRDAKGPTIPSSSATTVSEPNAVLGSSSSDPSISVHSRPSSKTAPPAETFRWSVPEGLHSSHASQLHLEMTRLIDQGVDLGSACFVGEGATVAYVKPSGGRDGAELVVRDLHVSDDVTRIQLPAGHWNGWTRTAASPDGKAILVIAEPQQAIVELASMKVTPFTINTRFRTDTQAAWASANEVWLFAVNSLEKRAFVQVLDLDLLTSHVKHDVAPVQRFLAKPEVDEAAFARADADVSAVRRRMSKSIRATFGFDDTPAGNSLMIRSTETSYSRMVISADCQWWWVPNDSSCLLAQVGPSKELRCYYFEVGEPVNLDYDILISGDQAMPARPEKLQRLKQILTERETAVLKVFQPKRNPLNGKIIGIEGPNIAMMDVVEMRDDHLRVRLRWDCGMRDGLVAAGLWVYRNNKWVTEGETDIFWGPISKASAAEMPPTGTDSAGQNQQKEPDEVETVQDQEPEVAKPIAESAILGISKAAGESAKGKVVIAVDCSESMASMLPEASEASKAILSSLRDSQSVSVGLLAAGDYNGRSAWALGVRPATAGFLDELEPFLDRIKTERRVPLVNVIELALETKPDTLWIVSDGEPKELQPVVEALKRFSRGKSFRVNTIVISGDRTSRRIMQDLASDHNGLCFPLSKQ